MLPLGIFFDFSKIKMMAYPAMGRNSGLLHSFPFVFFIFKTDCWLHWVFATAARLSRVAGSGGAVPFWCRASRVVASGTAEHSSRCGLQCLGHVGLVALWHVGSSQTKDRIQVSYSSRWILNHWTTREVLLPIVRGVNQVVLVLGLGVMCRL